MANSAATNSDRAEDVGRKRGREDYEGLSKGSTDEDPQRHEGSGPVRRPRTVEAQRRGMDALSVSLIFKSLHSKCL